MAVKPKVQKLRPGMRSLAVGAELPPLVLRVRGNKNKRTAKQLVEDGPVLIAIVALDAGGEMEEHYEGPVTMQCLLGRSDIKSGGGQNELSTGDLVIIDAGATVQVAAKEATALLITELRGDTQA